MMGGQQLLGAWSGGMPVVGRSRWRGGDARRRALAAERPARDIRTAEVDEVYDPPFSLIRTKPDG